MGATKIRYELAKIGVGNKVRFIGKYDGKIEYDYLIPRILLTDVYNAETQKYICDHLWVYVNKEIKEQIITHLLAGFLMIGEGKIYKYNKEVEPWVMQENYSIEDLNIMGYIVPLIYEDKYYFGYYTNKRVPKCLVDIGKEGIRFKSLESRAAILKNGYGSCFVPNSVIYYLTDKEVDENEIEDVKFYIKKEETDTNIILERVNEEKLTEETLNGTQKNLTFYKDIRYLLSDLKMGCLKYI